MTTTIETFTTTQDIHIGIPSRSTRYWPCETPTWFVTGGYSAIVTLPAGFILKTGPEPDANRITLEQPRKMFLHQGNCLNNTPFLIDPGPSFIIPKETTITFHYEIDQRIGLPDLRTYSLINPPPPDSMKTWPEYVAQALLKSGYLIDEKGNLSPKEKSWGYRSFPIIPTPAQDLTKTTPEPTNAPHRNPKPVTDPEFNEIA